LLGAYRDEPSFFCGRSGAGTIRSRALRRAPLDRMPPGPLDDRPRLGSAPTITTEARTWREFLACQPHHSTPRCHQCGAGWRGSLAASSSFFLPRGPAHSTDAGSAMQADIQKGVPNTDKHCGKNCHNPDALCPQTHVRSPPSMLAPPYQNGAVEHRLRESCARRAHGCEPLRCIGTVCGDCWLSLTMLSQGADASSAGLPSAFSISRPVRDLLECDS
jgi:hypothetical protein